MSINRTQNTQSEGATLEKAKIYDRFDTRGQIFETS